MGAHGGRYAGSQVDRFTFHGVPRDSGLSDCPTQRPGEGAFSKLIVYGQGKAVEISTPALLAFDSFAIFSQPVSPPGTVVDEGYWIVRYGQDRGSGEDRPFDRLRLIPADNPSESSVYYEGFISGWSEYDARWYRPRPGALTALEASLDEGSPSRPAVMSTADLPISSAGFLLGVVLALVLNSLYGGRHSG